MKKLIMIMLGGLAICQPSLAQDPPDRSTPEAFGIPLRAVQRLISDQAHADHVGALAQIKQDTGALVLASSADRWALEHGRVRGDTNYIPGLFTPIPVDRKARDGAERQYASTRTAACLQGTATQKVPASTSRRKRISPVV